MARMIPPVLTTRVANPANAITATSATPRASQALHTPVQLTGVDGPRESFGCAIPTSRLDSTALKVLPLIPPPNLQGFILNYHRAVRIPTATDIVNFRLLHSISPRFSLLGLFNLVQARGTSITSFPSLSGNAATRDQTATLGLTQDCTPQVVN